MQAQYPPYDSNLTRFRAVLLSPTRGLRRQRPQRGLLTRLMDTAEIVIREVQRIFSS